MYIVSVRSQNDDVPVVTESTGIVKMWRNIKVNNTVSRSHMTAML